MGECGKDPLRRYRRYLEAQTANYLKLRLQTLLAAARETSETSTAEGDATAPREAATRRTALSVECLETLSLLAAEEQAVTELAEALYGVLSSDSSNDQARTIWDFLMWILETESPLAALSSVTIDGVLEGLRRPRSSAFELSIMNRAFWKLSRDRVPSSRKRTHLSPRLSDAGALHDLEPAQGPAAPPRLRLDAREARRHQRGPQERARLDRAAGEPTGVFGANARKADAKRALEFSNLERHDQYMAWVRKRHAEALSVVEGLSSDSVSLKTPTELAPGRSPNFRTRPRSNSTTSNSCCPGSRRDTRARATEFYTRE